MTAKGTYDVASGRITGLEWEQADERESGPASPATEVKVKWTVKRAAVAGVLATMWHPTVNPGSHAGGGRS